MAALAAEGSHAAPKVTAEPSQVVLGTGTALTIRVSEVDPARPLYVASSSGALQEQPRSSGNRERVFSWTPPDIRFPTHAVLVFWQPAQEGPEAAALQVPLLGRTVLEMDTEPGAEVRVRVGGATFGPVAANARGRVKVPIEVPPGVRSAQVMATAKGLQTSRAVPLEVPETSPFALSVGPEPLPAAGEGWAIVATPSGKDAARVSVEVEGARTRRLAHEADELAIYQLQPEPGAQRVRVAAASLDARRETKNLLIPVVEGTAEPVASGGGAASGRWSAQVILGGYHGGGANRGLAAEGGVAFRLPHAGGRLFAEAAVGLRSAALTTHPPGLGRLESTVWVVPVVFGARGRLWERGPFALDARLGLGPAPFRHRVTASFQPAFVEGGIGFEAFGAVQGAFRVTSFEVVAELRGDFTNVRTPYVFARPGGLVAFVGGRWTAP